MQRLVITVRNLSPTFAFVESIVTMDPIRGNITKKFQILKCNEYDVLKTAETFIAYLHHLYKKQSSYFNYFWAIEILNMLVE